MEVSIWILGLGGTCLFLRSLPQREDGQAERLGTIRVMHTSKLGRSSGCSDIYELLFRLMLFQIEAREKFECWDQSHSQS
jgi:hypothetical protein